MCILKHICYLLKTVIVFSGPGKQGYTELALHITSLSCIQFQISDSIGLPENHLPETEAWSVRYMVRSIEKDGMSGQSTF